MIRLVFTLCAAALVGFGHTHAYLAASVPAQDSVVSEEHAPAFISLEFTEGIELSFSTFKLVRVQHDLNVTADTFALRLNALVAPQAVPLLDTRDDVEGEQQVTIQPASGTVAQLELHLLQPLTPGSYMLVWRALSADSHIVEGYLVFTVVQ